jgi:hypothetical protein
MSSLKYPKVKIFSIVFFALLSILFVSLLMAPSIDYCLLSEIFLGKRIMEDGSIVRLSTALSIALTINAAIIFGEVFSVIFAFLSRVKPKKSVVMAYFFTELLLFISFVAMHLPRDPDKKILALVIGLIVFVYYSNHLLWFAILHKNEKQ